MGYSAVPVPHPMYGNGGGGGEMGMEYDYAASERRRAGKHTRRVVVK